MDEPLTAVPPGFQPLFRTSPFLELIGPLYGLGDGAELRVGLRAANRHCNGKGTVHGGVLATIADIAIGYTTALSTRPPLGLITASLNIDYLGAARRNSWIEASTTLHRIGERLAFASCSIAADAAVVAQGRAIFAVQAPSEPSRSTAS